MPFSMALALKSSVLLCAGSSLISSRISQHASLSLSYPRLSRRRGASTLNVTRLRRGLRYRLCRTLGEQLSKKESSLEKAVPQAGVGAGGKGITGLPGRGDDGEAALLQDDKVSGSPAAVSCYIDDEPPSEKEKPVNLGELARRFVRVATPYWGGDDKGQARARLAGVFVLTLCTTGVSVTFNFLGRDFYNALASKDQEVFTRQLLYYLGAFAGGIPVFVLRDYFRDSLSLRWRAWMTNFYMEKYFQHRTFYNIQSQSLIDNPDQRIVDDLNAFTGTALGFSLALFNATIDLISFSGILYSIYPPLFAVLIVYSLGGTAISIWLGKDLVGLNFRQEKREADFRYGLVRVRENAESIAFYGGEQNETALLLQRFRQSFDNYSRLLIASRNLDFFTSGYRYLIQLLPAAVVAPLFFRGEIEFGVINQSFSAFNHVLADFSIIVYQFQALSAFSAVVNRLGEFNDVLDELSKRAEEPQVQLANQTEPSMAPSAATATLSLDDEAAPTGSGPSSSAAVPLLELENLSVYTPQTGQLLVQSLSLTVRKGQHLLIMGPSGSGKTSLLRTIAGLWRSGTGTVRRYVGMPPTATEDNGTLTAGAAPTNGATVKVPPPRESAESEFENSPTEPTSNSPLPLSAHASSPSSSSSPPSSPSPSPSPSSSSSSSSSSLSPSFPPPSPSLSPPSPSSGGEDGAGEGDVDGPSDAQGLVFFVPQRPYMVLGTLRQQLLYPTWVDDAAAEGDDAQAPVVGQSFPVTTRVPHNNNSPHNVTLRPRPSDAELVSVLHRVRLSALLDRCDGLDARVEWASVLSLGEQQRLAFARLLLSRPLLALMDESTSALDENNESHLYAEVEAMGVTFVSVGHRSSLKKFHTHVLTLSEAGTRGDTESGLSWELQQLSKEPALVK